MGGALRPAPVGFHPRHAQVDRDSGELQAVVGSQGPHAFHFNNAGLVSFWKGSAEVLFLDLDLKLELESALLSGKGGMVDPDVRSQKTTR